ncbi:FIST N-terminal domain-containing protein [Yoonia sp. SS1-5]|uniref:FIST N-terminal domain-containing protein n=1 Tax=Yoonia rhodophyticola TaxID=3137370 RepID=A0AAN0MLV2_9RHOB
MTTELPLQSGLLRKAEVRCSTTSPVAALGSRLGDTPLCLLILFVTPQIDFAAVVGEASALYPDTVVVACTTAGEIGAGGYDEGLIVAIGFPSADFAATSLAIANLDRFQAEAETDRIAQERVALQDRNPDMETGFAFLIVDGLSRREDTLTATISPALRDMPLFGASAGDGTDFQATLVALNGQIMTNGAVLTLIRSQHQTQVFSLDHLIPTETQMVVTDADPERRIVKSINAEPAAREYARIVGKDPDQLDRFTFASHPVVVRIGGDHHVRAIQQVNEAGELVFFSAIDEGMVLTVAEPQNMADHLRARMEVLSADATPTDIIGCDCILRRIEAEQTQMSREISTLLSEYNVTGFSTYGEQIGPLHVNQTMTGVAFYRKAQVP